MKNKHGLTILVVFIIGASLIVSCQSSDEGSDGEFTEAFMGSLSASATANGQVHPKKEATLAMEIPGRVENVAVSKSDHVKTGDVLVQLEPDLLEFNVAAATQALKMAEATLAMMQAEPTAANVAVAETAVAAAQAHVDAVRDGPLDDQIVAAQAEARAAQSAVAAASSQLSQVRAGASEAQIAAAKVQLAQAEAERKFAELAFDSANQEERDTDSEAIVLASANEAKVAAQIQLDDLLAGADQDIVGGAQARVAASAAQQEAAQAQLSQLERGSSDMLIAGAEAQLAQAEANLDALLTGASEEKISAAEAQVEQARIALDEAEDALAKATLVAPFDGVITVVFISEGEIAAGPVISIIDPKSLEVILDVDEVDIGTLAIGQPATITLEAWPDIEIESEITSIAPGASSGIGFFSDLVTYAVHLGLGQTDLPIMMGMTAEANLVTAERDNVLLVPNRALRFDRQTGKSFVNLALDDTVREVEVVVGLRDHMHTQIISGLVAGDQLLIVDQTNRFEFDIEGNGDIPEGNFGSSPFIGG